MEDILLHHYHDVQRLKALARDVAESMMQRLRGTIHSVYINSMYIVHERGHETKICLVDEY